MGLYLIISQCISNVFYALSDLLLILCVVGGPLNRVLTQYSLQLRIYALESPIDRYLVAAA